MWYLNEQVTSSSKTRSHVDIQVRNNVVLGIYIHVVRINRWLNYDTVELQVYRYLVDTLSHVSIQFHT